MIKYIIINGYPGSGKTTFELAIKQQMNDNVAIISSIDKIKEVAYLLGWNGEKTPKMRRFLSILKELASEYFDTSWKAVEQLAIEEHKAKGSPENYYVLVDVREPEEIKRYQTERDAITVFINREEVSHNDQSNVSDINVNAINYDYYVNNNGNIQDLQNEVKKFILYLETGLSGEVADESIK